MGSLFFKLAFRFREETFPGSTQRSFERQRSLYPGQGIDSSEHCLHPGLWRSQTTLRW